MSVLLNDIKYAFRQLRHSPGFTVVAVLTLALGIGANTAVFGLLSSIMLRSLPVQDAQGLRVLTWSAPPLRDTNFWYGRPVETPGGAVAADVFTYPTYRRLREQTAGEAEVFGFAEFTNLSPLTVLAGGQASTARGLMVSGNFFQGLGLSPLLGPGLTLDHDRPEAEPVTVISYAAWQQHFDGDAQVLGRSVTLDNQDFTIVGVLPRDFRGLVAGYPCDYYIPFSQQPRMCPNCPLASDRVYWVQAMARLASGADEARVKSALDVLFAQSVQGLIADDVDNTAHVVMEDGRGGPLTPRVALAKSLWLLMGLAGILLLVTCVNLAGIMLARGLRRRHEMSVHLALGAGRADLIRQHLIEGLFIALAGTVGGLILAVWTKTVLVHLIWPVDVTLDVPNDLRLFWFAIGTATATALTAALLPAWRSTRTDATDVLRDRSGSGMSRLRWGRALVATQMGLSLMVLAGAGLFGRTLINLYRVETGFDAKDLLVFKIDATKTGYQDQALVGFYEQVRSSLEALPGVKAVANSNYLLLSGKPMSSSTVHFNRTDAAEMTLRVRALHISDSFLSTLGIPLLQGRSFRETDSASQAKVVIVNQTLARTVFPKEDPVGRRLPWSQEEIVIVGVCGDFKDISLKQPVEPTVFYPYHCLPQNVPPQLVWSYYAVQTDRDPWTLVPAVRKVVSDLDPTIPLTNVNTQVLQRNQSIARERCFAALASSLAFLAVLLSCVGLYGIMAYSVTDRTSEIGLRMALGATSGQVAWTILRGALLVVIAGLALGVPAFLATARITRRYLFGVETYDPVTLVSAILLLVAVATLAAWFPARRAAKVDPMEALRCE